MKVAVLLKQVPDLAEELEVDESGKALDTEYIKFRLNEYDEHALEEGSMSQGGRSGCGDCCFCA
ncbi:MAG: hypothetical protein Ct9H300mP28_02160 [Pseudomonadota bacterium]|nr:MAG: hypothetical protein Ct9H300mP28_02160 [Pseudomonadota bacterium]